VLLAPPDQFDGTVADFVDEYVLANAPDPIALAAATESLLDYFSKADSILLLRGVPRGHLHTADKRRVVYCDNAPAIWCYLRCFRQDPTPDALPRAIDHGDVAILMAATRDEKQKWNFGKAMSTRDKQFIWKARLKLCHVFPVAEAGLTRVQQTVRNICPINHFLFPSPKRFSMLRVGWSEPHSKKDLGESAEVIAVIFDRVVNRLGSSAGQQLVRTFREAAGTLAAGEVHGHYRIAVRRTG
jgi:hypothetical protein